MKNSLFSFVLYYYFLLSFTISYIINNLSEERPDGAEDDRREFSQ